MKTLIIYYSRTGNTKHVAEMMAKELSADLEELTDKKSRKGIIGWLKAGRDASKARSTDITELTKDLTAYDTVVIGQPVWAWTMVPAIRALLAKNPMNKKNVAMFCTMGGNGHEQCFMETAKLMPEAKFVGSQAFINPLRLKLQTENLVKDFAKRITEATKPVEPPKEEMPPAPAKTVKPKRKPVKKVKPAAKKAKPAKKAKKS